MNNNFITLESDCLTINKREYLSQLSFDSSRIRQDKKIELDMKQEYSGRELYEMIQNADDEGSPKIELILTSDNHFHIKNWGNNPFSEGGLLSIMRSFLSTKRNESYKNMTVRPIGNKGLGFRSLLNWSDKISIHSNGVKCSFSEDIAKREWGQIKKEGLKSGNLTQESIRNFERERPNNLPLPILSIPETARDNITKQNCFDLNGACTTDIEVLCKEPSVVSDIATKLSSLPCSILLFLRNIERIDINNKGQKRIITKVKIETITDGFEKITINDNGNDICFAVCKHISENRLFEVGVAFALTDFNYNHYLYSYFPTQVRLSVPAIYHGTFELDSSRNHLVNTDQNKIILNKLGEVAVKLSENLVSYKLLSNVNWAPFNILNFTFADINTAMLSPLSESIKSHIKDAKILPRVNSTFSSIESTVRLSDKLASWLLEINPEIYQHTSLNHHLIPISQKVFASDRYLSDFVLNRLKKDTKDIQTIARKELTVEDRVNFIDAVVDCVQTKISILTDANGKIIEANNDNPAYVLSMQGNTILPQCLKIKSVDSELINRLLKKWNLLNIRQVTDKLQNITSVINGDHTAIRRKIENWSAKDMDCEGMREVLKWEFDNPTKDATAFTSDLYLINRLGERTKTCSLLLDEPKFDRELLKKVDDKWLLQYSLAEWTNILGTTDDNETSQFLYKIIGVSQRVPSEHIYFGQNLKYLDDVRNDNNKSQIGNQYCDNFESYNKISKEYNYSFVPVEDYLSNFSLTEALGLILKDERVLANIMDNNISLSFRTKKSETVRCSFSAYTLKSYKQFLPLQFSLIQSPNFGCNIDYNYLEKNLSIDRISQINPLLVILGAQTKISNFSTEQLYNILSQKVEPSGIQKRYKELREAIRNKNETDSALHKIRTQFLTHVWARINGQLEWKPIEEVYYWDNDQLPKFILTTLPKLEIGNRVGEESISKIFGVKLAKNVNISFRQHINNESLLNDIKKYLSERIKYFLAFRIGDDVKDLSLIRQSVNALKNLCKNLHIYTSAEYFFNKDSHSMKEGDILASYEDGNIHFHICSSFHNYTNALANPIFCENINEAVCMALKVTSNTMANYFRNIITSTIHYIEYITKKDITPEVWKLTLKSLGLSEYEQTFWKTYFDSQTAKIDLSQLTEHITDTRDFILGIYPHLKIPETYTSIEELSPYEKYKLLLSMNVDNCSMLGEDGLKSFYQEYFIKKQKQYAVQYKSILYNETARNICKNLSNSLSYIEDYQNKCLRFDEPFFDELIDEIKLKLISENELDTIISDLIKTKFNFTFNENKIDVLDTPISILPEYEKILDEFHLSEGCLSQTDAIIAKFNGLEDLFRLRIKEYENADSILHHKVNSTESTKPIAIEIATCHSILRDYNPNIKPNGKRKHQSGYKSDKAKYLAGKEAEIKTLNAMKTCGKYEDVYGHSSILNKENGDDNLHYDISYRKKGTPMTAVRYLDVKNGKTFYMSCLEYEFARTHCENYDLAIYHDGKVSIIECPFSSKNGKKPLDVQTETYRLTIEMD